MLVLRIRVGPSFQDIFQAPGTTGFISFAAYWCLAISNSPTLPDSVIHRGDPIFAAVSKDIGESIPDITPREVQYDAGVHDEELLLLRINWFRP